MRIACLALLALSIVGCSEHGSTDGSTDGSTNTCPRGDGGTPHTIGTVACGSVPDCPAGQCLLCTVNPGPAEQLCGNPPPGAVCNSVIGCDGPEDCAPGERCFVFESPRCATSPSTGESTVCHTDDDCDCGEHCDFGTCRALTR